MYRVLMILENNGFPEDVRVMLEATALRDAGFDVTIICPRRSGQPWREVWEGIQVRRYPEPIELPGGLGHAIEFGYSLIAASLLSIAVKLSNGFDAIHVHAPPDTNALLGWFWRRTGVRFIYDMHDLSPELFQAQRGGRGNRWIHNVLLVLERLACRSADRLIATNSTQQMIQVQRAGADPQRCYIVRNGPHEQFLAETPRPAVWDVENATVIGYVGQIAVQDGVDNFVRMMAALVHKHRRRDVLGVIVGDGPAHADLQELARELKVEQFMRFTGGVPFSEVPGYIASFDICVTPDPINDYNNSCTTIKTMEYMALGKPVVLFATTENLATVGDAGVVADGSPEGLAEAVVQLLDAPERRRRLGELGQARIKNGMRWCDQAKVLVDIYEDLRAERTAIPGRRQRRSWTERAQEHSDPERRNQNHDHQLTCNCRPAFDGILGAILQEEILRDSDYARLSWKYRCYYRCRPLIPKNVRSVLQTITYRRRSADNWFIPSAFAARFRRGVVEVLKQSPNLETVAPWPDNASLAVVLTHDVESAEGFERILEIAELEEQRGLRSSWNIVPALYPVDLGVLRELKNRGHEVGIHGLSHDGRLFLSRSVFDQRARRINAIAKQWGAVGFRAPMVHRQLEWMQQLRFEYDSSCFDIDPYQAMPGGVGTPWPFIYGRLVELPYTLPQDHTLYRLRQDPLTVWRRKTRYLQQLRGMHLLLTHPDYLDVAERKRDYGRWLDELRELDGAWFALPREVARWWRQRDRCTGDLDAARADLDGQASGLRRVRISELFADFLQSSSPSQPTSRPAAQVETA